jgi:AbrB family looped-hinge helix DNA binding protein
MKEESRVGERGQIVIPKQMRDEFGLHKNTAVKFERRPNGLLLTRSREQEMRNFDLAMKKYAGSLRKQFLRKYKSVDQYLDETRGIDETRRK